MGPGVVWVLLYLCAYHRDALQVDHGIERSEGVLGEVLLGVLMASCRCRRGGGSREDIVHEADGSSLLPVSMDEMDGIDGIDGMGEGNSQGLVVPDGLWMDGGQSEILVSPEHARA